MEARHDDATLPWRCSLKICPIIVPPCGQYHYCLIHWVEWVELSEMHVVLLKICAGTDLVVSSNFIREQWQHTIFPWIMHTGQLVSFIKGRRVTWLNCIEQEEYSCGYGSFRAKPRISRRQQVRGGQWMWLDYAKNEIIKALLLQRWSKKCVYIRKFCQCIKNRFVSCIENALKWGKRMLTKSMDQMDNCG